MGRTTKSTLMWNFLGARQDPYLIQRTYVGRESAMNTKCFAVNYLHRMPRGMESRQAMMIRSRKGDIQQRDLDSRKHYNKLSKRLRYHTFADIRLRWVSRQLSWSEWEIWTIKSVDLCYLPTLVVSSEKGDFVRVPGWV